VADRFTKDRFNWIEQVVGDCQSLPPNAGFVAMALIKYFSREKDGWAWMAQTTLACDLGISESTVRRSLSALVDRGHLISKRRGREETNLYHLALKENESDRAEMNGHDQSDLNGHDRSEMHGHNDVVTGQNCTSDRSNPAKVTGHICTRNPMNDSFDDSFEGKRTNQRGDSTPKSRRRQSQIPFPADFVLTEELAKHAADKASWDYNRSTSEFERFENHHRAKGSIFADWSAAWRTWITNGVRFDRDRAQQQPTGPVIDEHGNPVTTSPPWQHQGGRQPYRRRSNADAAFSGAQGHEY
jgi:hypothetical protein